MKRLQDLLEMTDTCSLQRAEEKLKMTEEKRDLQEAELKLKHESTGGSPEAQKLPSTNAADPTRSATPVGPFKPAPLT